jgi:hypothetical protein
VSSAAALVVAFLLAAWARERSQPLS